MVTSNKFPEKKIVKMAEQNNGVVVPQRTLLGEVNEHLACPLCRGYYIDATTIVECLHSFCRSCIIKHLQVKSYCPVCEMMINAARPNIKPDKALQDIVYKLVPGLFQKEMERRQHFYSTRPGQAASATPEQRGEDTERIIFSPEDVISFSLEYSDITDTDSISSKSSDSNESQPTSATARRYLQCPAVVNISHLKKFLGMKFDIDSTQFAIDILYKRVPLPDYYTLMDIAYIYNWKRNEPMRFFYQIIDYIAIRNRLFDINHKGSHFRDRKSSPAPTEDTNMSSPAPHTTDQCSEPSSGTDSPKPDDNPSKQMSDIFKKSDKSVQQAKLTVIQESENLVKNLLPAKKNDDEVEKSEFLNSFELKAKSDSNLTKSPSKSSSVAMTENVPVLAQSKSPRAEDSLKRISQAPLNIPEMKKLKIELEKSKLPDMVKQAPPASSQGENTNKSPEKTKESGLKSLHVSQSSKISLTASLLTKDTKQLLQTVKQPTQAQESPGLKRSIPLSHNISSPKRKTPNDQTLSRPTPSTTQKLVLPLKLQVPKLEPHTPSSKPIDIPKPVLKKIPDLKPTMPAQTNQMKGHQVNKVRMDLLANNSDPTIDRSKILSQVKSSLSSLPGASQTSGNPLKSLFDSCKLNIPSSLSITLTDQKQEVRNSGEPGNADTKKTVVNKNIIGASNVSAHKVPSPPVHNYIEILKLPESDKKNKTNMTDVSIEDKVDPSTPGKPISKLSESPVSAKGPVPNLKPIADTKLAKQGNNFGGPITFQQTFEQQLQTLQSDKKPKLAKNKTQVPKLVPATPKSFNAVNAANKLNNPIKPNQNTIPSLENKPSTALDLSTPHNMQNQLSTHQTKTLEKMQSIANLAKKQSLPQKVAQTISQGFSGVPSRPPSTNVGPMRLPTSNVPQIKHDKGSASGLQTNLQESANKSNLAKGPSASPGMSSSYQMSPSTHTSQSPAQPSPRSTRSPSSSPKLVIAEDKQTNSMEQSVNQSNQITSTQLSNLNTPSEVLKSLPGTSKPGLKPLKPSTSTGKPTGIRQPITPTVKPSPTPTDYQIISAHHQALFRHQMDAWIKAQRQFDLYKNITNIAHQAQNDFNKDK